jgi:hypothetical protein
MVRVLIVVLLLVLSGCAAGDDPTVGLPGSSPGPPAAGSEPTDDVPPVLAFTAETVQGEVVAGSDYAGRDLLVWFWAPW